MRRAEVWWAELAGDSGFRPVAIISRPDGMARRRNVTIAEVTRSTRSLACEVPLSADDGMPSACVINTDNLHTIPTERFRQRILRLSDEKQFALDQALRYSLGLE